MTVTAPLFEIVTLLWKYSIITMLFFFLVKRGLEEWIVPNLLVSKTLLGAAFSNEKLYMWVEKTSLS